MRVWVLSLMSVLLVAAQLRAETIGIIGGADNSNDYAAFVVSGSTAPLPIAPLPPVAGSIGIDSVSINQFGQALIGGKTNPGTPAAYGAFIAPGSTTPMVITNLPTGAGNCFVNSVALNDLGQGLVGATNFNNPYVAWVIFGSTTALPLTSSFPPPGSGGIQTAAINQSGEGLIGGAVNGFQDAYAARVTFDSITPTPISGLPTGGFSRINSVALNQSNQGLIGGQDNGTAYAAFIDSGSTTPISISGLPVGAIGNTTYAGQGVVLNNFGQGLIGGNDNANAYAAWVSFDSGSPLPIMTLPAGGNSQILTVALNDYGPGLIGGQDNSSGTSAAYAAWVYPGSSTPTLITGLPSGGTSAIWSVALNQFGQGLIGGDDNGNGYAALLAPGSTTPVPLIGLPVGGGSVIASVALILRSPLPTGSLRGNNLIFANYINENARQDTFYFVPSFFNNTYSNALESAAPTRNALSVFAAVQNLFYLNQSLSLHLHNFSRIRKPLANSTVSNQINQRVGTRFFALSDALENDMIEGSTQQSEEDEPQKVVAPDLPPPFVSEDRPWTLWFEGIGVYASQDAQNQTVGFQPYGGGSILATDKIVAKNTKVGGGAAYTFTHISEDENAGHSSINQEFAFLYATWSYHGLHLDGGVWFGLFQTDQTRNINMTGFNFTATSHPSGFQLSPHFEIGYDSSIMRSDSGNIEFMVDPFAMIDWANSWQGSYREQGTGPFAAGQNAQYGSLLRSELGYRLYEAFPFLNWRLVIEEKLSYVNKTPFGIGKVTGFLVGSAGAFTLETLSSSQSLGAAEISFLFEPLDKKYPYGSISYQGEFNGSYQSHQGFIEVAWNF